MKPILLTVAGMLLLTAGSTGPRSGSHRVEIRGMSYRPASLSAAVGDTILWINRDPVPHTATAPGDDGWDTGEIAPGDTGRIVLKAGKASAYTCELHPSMQGSITTH